MEGSYKKLMEMKHFSPAPIRKDYLFGSMVGGSMQQNDVNLLDQKPGYHGGITMRNPIKNSFAGFDYNEQSMKIPRRKAKPFESATHDIDGFETRDRANAESCDDSDQFVFYYTQNNIHQPNADIEEFNEEFFELVFLMHRITDEEAKEEKKNDQSPILDPEETGIKMVMSKSDIELLLYKGLERNIFEVVYEGQFTA